MAALLQMSCPPMPDTCSWVDVPEGECCPLCMGCITEAGKKVPIRNIHSKIFVSEERVREYR